MNATAALELEVLYVAQFDSYHTGYNSTFGGDHYLDSNWQRENQLKRVSNGTHPFMGGEIQRKSGKKRWVEGTNSLIGLNEKRVATDSHNFQGDNNPTRRLSKLGLHHNQKPSWLNTKANKSTWLLADTIYQKWIETAWSYKKLQTYFNLNSHLGKIISKFRQGWNPTDDPKWIKWKALN